MNRFLPENPNESIRARLGICTGIQVSNAIDGWCLVHRCHHKYQDSTSDPHDPRRGFLYSHIGWLLQTRHPDSIKALQEVRSQCLSGHVCRFSRTSVTKAQLNPVKKGMCSAVQARSCSRFGLFWRTALLHKLVED